MTDREMYTNLFRREYREWKACKGLPGMRGYYRDLCRHWLTLLRWAIKSERANQ